MIIYLRLLNLCISPDERKRLGSSNVLSKIHKLIREEVSLISRYVLNITFSLFQSHRLGGKCQDVKLQFKTILII